MYSRLYGVWCSAVRPSLYECPIIPPTSGATVSCLGAVLAVLGEHQPPLGCFEIKRFQKIKQSILRAPKQHLSGFQVASEVFMNGLEDIQNRSKCLQNECHISCL